MAKLTIAGSTQPKVRLHGFLLGCEPSFMEIALDEKSQSRNQERRLDRLPMIYSNVGVGKVDKDV